MLLSLLMSPGFYWATRHKMAGLTTIQTEISLSASCEFDPAELVVLLVATGIPVDELEVV